ncbi:MAG: 50S ribosomal protein L30 [Deltaproteobacteria bacterium]|nr:50S ribosomal protein L30 [Deltaproteobacteria bacterium]
MADILQVEKIHSAIARNRAQKKVLLSLGLNRRHQVKYLKATPATLGMAKKVCHLLNYKVISEKDIPKVKPLSTYQLGALPEKNTVQAKPKQTVAKRKSTPTKKKAAKSAK